MDVITSKYEGNKRLETELSGATMGDLRAEIMRMDERAISEVILVLETGPEFFVGGGSGRYTLTFWNDEAGHGGTFLRNGHEAEDTVSIVVGGQRTLQNVNAVHGFEDVFKELEACISAGTNSNSSWWKIE